MSLHSTVHEGAALDEAMTRIHGIKGLCFAVLLLLSREPRSAMINNRTRSVESLTSFFLFFPSPWCVPVHYFIDLTITGSSRTCTASWRNIRINHSQRQDKTYP
jgi:hypothetical protein